MMAILLVIAGILAFCIFGILAAIRIFQIISLVVLLFAGICLVVICFVSFAVGGIVLALLYQMLGPEHSGWIIAAAIAAGLLTGWQLLNALLRKGQAVARKWGFVKDPAPHASSVSLSDRTASPPTETATKISP